MTQNSLQRATKLDIYIYINIKIENNNNSNQLKKNIFIIYIIQMNQ